MILEMNSITCTIVVMQYGVRQGRQPYLPTGQKPQTLQRKLTMSISFFLFFKGKLFENGNRYAKSDNTIQKGLNERIPNDILHVKFKRKSSLSQSNLLYPRYGVYVYKYLKRQKRPKRVKMLTSKWHRKQEYFFIHLHNRSFQCIRFVEKHFFSVTNNG